MKRTSVYLDEEQARQLRRLAGENGRSFAAMVREALGEYLERRGAGPIARVTAPPRQIPEDEWQARWDAVLQRLRAGVPSDMSPEEIEAEITAASEEARQERAARRRAASA